jgi:hypothetical protein
MNNPYFVVYRQLITCCIVVNGGICIARNQDLYFLSLNPLEIRLSMSLQNNYIEKQDIFYFFSVDSDPSPFLQAQIIKESAFPSQARCLIPSHIPKPIKIL